MLKSPKDNHKHARPWGIEADARSAAISFSNSGRSQFAFIIATEVRYREGRNKISTKLLKEKEYNPENVFEFDKKFIVCMAGNKKLKWL